MVFGDIRGGWFASWVSKKPRKPPVRVPHAKRKVADGEFAWLAYAIEERVVEMGISVRALAERMAVNASRVHKTLQRQRRIDPLEWLDWADALELGDPTEFLRDLKRKATAGQPPDRARRKTRQSRKPDG
jgi:hypothetical protein